jgi:hypothetical protein
MFSARSSVRSLLCVLVVVVAYAEYAMVTQPDARVRWGEEGAGKGGEGEEGESSASSTRARRNLLRGGALSECGRNHLVSVGCVAAHE